MRTSDTGCRFTLSRGGWLEPVNDVLEDFCARENHPCRSRAGSQESMSAIDSLLDSSGVEIMEAIGILSMKDLARLFHAAGSYSQANTLCDALVQRQGQTDKIPVPPDMYPHNVSPEPDITQAIAEHDLSLLMNDLKKDNSIMRHDVHIEIRLEFLLPTIESAAESIVDRMIENLETQEGFYGELGPW